MLLAIKMLQAFTNNMFDTKEQEIIKYGLANGKTQQEVQTALTNYRLGITPTNKTTPKEQTYLQDAGSDIKQIGTDIKSSVIERTKKINEAMDAGIAGKQSAFTTAKQQVFQGLGAVSDIFGNIIKGVVKAVLPQKAETAIKSGISAVATPIVQTNLVKGIINRYNTLDENTKRELDAELGLVSFVADVATSGVGKKVGEIVVEQGAKGVLKVGEIAGKAFDATGKIIEPAISTASKVGSGIKTIGQATANQISEIPGRIATNVSAGQTALKAIEELPTQVAKTAVKNGIDISDVKYLYKLPAEQKQPLKQLFQATKDFVSGVSKTNPIEIVGKPIVARLKTLKSNLGTIGQKLGVVADNLGTITTKEIYPEILNSLKKVPGLNGLTINSKGILNFKNTVLQSAETVADRKAIQRIFTDAIKSGTGKQKHLLRQELFEVLGGKKGAMVAMTATQDKAYQAIRKGLSNVLDAKNSAYKALNLEYAKIASPLANMSKFMKLNKLLGAGEDILNMDAGLLARRLTSNAISNPQIRYVLRELDNATKIVGKTTLNVENLQDFYNLLDKYYNIAGKTSLQGQVQLGVEKVSGLKDLISQTIGKVAGKTEDVKMKAIEDILNEVLK